MLKGRSWKKIPAEIAEIIKRELLNRWGEEKNVEKDQYKIWSIKFYDSERSYFLSKKWGTLYFNGSQSNHPVVKEIVDFVEELLGWNKDEGFDLLIGLDEAGKGEVAGHVILVAVVIPQNLKEKVKNILGTADTKKKRSFKYWNDLYREIDGLRQEWLEFIIEKIPPWIFDKYNINEIMDVTYQRMLAVFNNKYNLFNKKVRVVIDDYGIGENLKTFLNFLRKNWVEALEKEKADENFIEVRLASVIAKWQREAVIETINNNEKFVINWLKIWGGNVSNEDTLRWLQERYKSGKERPWFIKRSFSPIRKLEGKPKIKKLSPPFRRDLLSPDFVEKFNKWILSIKSLSLICPYCGSILKSAKFVNYVDKQTNYRFVWLRCENEKCGKIIDEVNFILRYASPYLLPDTNALTVLVKDLKNGKFFEDFYILISDIVFREMDGKNKGKKIFDELRKFRNMGRIKLKFLPKRFENIENMVWDSYKKDDMIIQEAIDYNAIFFTWDKSAATKAVGKEVFTILI